MNKIHSVFQALTLENSMYSITLKNCLFVRYVKAVALAYTFVDVFMPTAVLKPNFILIHSVYSKISDSCCGIKGLLEPTNIFEGCIFSTQLPCLFLFCLLSFVPCVVLSCTCICVLLPFFRLHAVKPGY
jgi:hypothetical protein